MSIRPKALALLPALLLVACDGPTTTAIEPDEPAVAVEASHQSVPIPDGVLFPCTEGVQSSGALYRVCFPDPAVADWNGSFVVYAHGYVPNLGQPLEFTEETEELAAFVHALGFGFAATTYSVNGLAILEGVQDVSELSGILRMQFGVPGLILLAGPSEGGAVTTLAAEQAAGVFQGALSTCGPTGSFQRQLDAIGHFHVLFNYFFNDPVPVLNVGTPNGVAPAIRDNWDVPGGVRDQALAAIIANPRAARELIRVSRAAVDPTDPNTVANTILGLLRYNVLATDDALAKLGGQPFDNTRKWYWGSSNDFRLNRRVQRIRADAGARAVVASMYETTGRLAMPYVSIHTTLDEIVEFRQQPIYRAKATFNGSGGEHSAFPVLRYGHCNFTDQELSLGLGLLVVKVGLLSPAAVESAMTDTDLRESFRESVRVLRTTH